MDIIGVVKKMTPEQIEYARKLFNAAEKNWEFHDSTREFMDFAWRCQDNFLDLLDCIKSK